MSRTGRGDDFRTLTPTEAARAEELQRMAETRRQQATQAREDDAAQGAGFWSRPQ